MSESIKITLTGGNGTGSIGKSLLIGAKSKIDFLKPGAKIEFGEDQESVMLDIGIGNNNTAFLVMTKDAWEALNAGAEISITTLQQYRRSLK